MSSASCVTIQWTSSSLPVDMLQCAVSVHPRPNAALSARCALCGPYTKMCILYHLCMLKQSKIRLILASNQTSLLMLYKQDTFVCPHKLPLLHNLTTLEHKDILLDHENICLSKVHHVLFNLSLLYFIPLLDIC